MAAPKGRHLDDLATKVHMRKAEAATDKAAIAEQGANLVRMRIGGDVEVLGLTAKQQVAHAATHEITLKASGLETVKNL